MAPTRGTAQSSFILLLLVWALRTPGQLPADAVDTLSRSTPPFVKLGLVMSDEQLLTALRGASLAESMDLLLGAAESVHGAQADSDHGAQYDRLRLLRGLLDDLPHQSAYVRQLLAALYLERAYFGPDGEPRSLTVPEASLTYLDDHLGRAGNTGSSPDLADLDTVNLASIYLRLAAAYRRAPSGTALMQTGHAVLRELERTSGMLDASWNRLAYAYLECTLLRPDPASALLVDDIRRASRSHRLATRAGEVSRMLFD